MTEGSGAPDLRGLGERYEVLGELRGTDAGRTYIARPRDGSAEVAITVVSAPAGAQNNELSHFAADVQILESLTNPTLVRVLGGQWVGSDSYAIVTERVNGETLGELLDRGLRFTNPRIALILQEINGVLESARAKGVVHRAVTPDTVIFERDSNRLRVSFAPDVIPITGVSGAGGDVRTLGKLAWAMFTGDRYGAGAAGKSLGDVAPNLATRVIEATDKAIRYKDDAPAPDIATFVGIIGSGDVLKQAEVELAAQKEEYDEAHRREIQKCELQRIAVEERAAEQAAALAGEREEFARQMADERAAIEAERAEFEALTQERRDRLAAVRAELDGQRAEMEKRLADLEAYRLEVEKARDAALAAAENARKEAIADAERWREEILAAAAAASGTSTADAVASIAAPKPASVPKIPIPAAPRALKEMKAPKWDRTMERLDVSDEELIGANNRPIWFIPAIAAAIVLIVVSGIYGITHRRHASDLVKVGNSSIVATPPTSEAAPVIPRGGFLTQPAVGAALDTSAAAAATTAATAAPARIDSAAGAVQTPAVPAAPKPDSVAAARRRAAALARREPTQEEIDSVNTAPEEWARIKRADSIARARRDSAARRDSLARRPVPPRPLTPLATLDSVGTGSSARDSNTRSTAIGYQFPSGAMPNAILRRDSASRTDSMARRLPGLRPDSNGRDTVRRAPPPPAPPRQPPDTLVQLG